MRENYTFEMRKYECDWVQDYMVMLVNGKEVARENVTNIHETFAARCSQVRRELIARYENS